MDYEFLKKNGTFLGEHDIYDGWIYCGTEKYYLYNNSLYVRKEPDNRTSYRGKTRTYLMIDNVKEEIDQKNEMYFCVFLNLPEEVYSKLCNICK